MSHPQPDPQEIHPRTLSGWYAGGFPCADCGRGVHHFRDVLDHDWIYTLAVHYWYGCLTTCTLQVRPAPAHYQDAAA